MLSASIRDLIISNPPVKSSPVLEEATRSPLSKAKYNENDLARVSYVIIALLAPSAHPRGKEGGREERISPSDVDRGGAEGGRRGAGRGAEGGGEYRVAILQFRRSTCVLPLSRGLTGGRGSTSEGGTSGGFYRGALA